MIFDCRFAVLAQTFDCHSGVQSLQIVLLEIYQRYPFGDEFASKFLMQRTRNDYSFISEVHFIACPTVEVLE